MKEILKLEIKYQGKIKSRSIYKNPRSMEEMIHGYKIGCTYGYYNIDKENDKLKARYSK